MKYGSRFPANLKPVAILVLAGMLALAGCLAPGVGKRSDAVTVAPATDETGASITGNIDPARAFELTLYERVRQDCSSCHGVGQSPLFAVADVDSARAAIEPYVNLPDPGSSPILNRVQDSHCGSNCFQDPKDFQTLIERWNAAANGS